MCAKSCDEVMILTMRSGHAVVTRHVSSEWVNNCLYASINLRQHFVTCFFYGGELLAQSGGPPLVTRPPPLIQYTFNYPPHLEAVSSICNPQMHHAMATSDPLNTESTTIKYIM
jgi:hypothetical protein